MKKYILIGLFTIIFSILIYLGFRTKQLKEDLNQGEKIDIVVNENTKKQKENSNKDTFTASDGTVVHFKDNVIDSIDQIDFSAQEREKEGLGVLAIDKDGYYVTNYNDFDYDKDGNLPDVKDKIKTPDGMYHGFEPYTLDLSKKLDQRLYEAIQWSHESAKKRTLVDQSIIDKLEYYVYKKGNQYKIVLGGLTKEEKEDTFYLGKIELDYLSSGNYFGGLLPTDVIKERNFDELYSLSGQKTNTIENIKYTDTDQEKINKMKMFIYSFVYNSSDIQKGNDILIDISKSNSLFLNDGLELECFSGEFEDLTYGYKLKLGNLCAVFENKNFIGYSNEMIF